MSKWDENARWVDIWTGEIDEDGDEVFEYSLGGSEALSPFEAMVFAACGVEANPDPNIYLDV